MSKRKRRRQRNLDPIRDITNLSFASGAGSIALESVGQSSVPLANISQSLPVAGTASGAGMLLGSLQTLNPKRKKRRKSFY